MKNVLMKIRYYALLVLGVNIATILLGCVYILVPSHSAFWDFSGWLYLVSWMSGIPLTLMVFPVEDAHSPRGKVLNYFAYLTLVGMLFGTFAQFGTSFLVSLTVYTIISEIMGYYGIIYGIFLGISILNCWFALNMKKHVDIALKRNSDDVEDGKAPNKIQNTEAIQKPHFRKFTMKHILGLMFFAAGMVWMFYFALLVLNGYKMGIRYIPTIGGFNGILGALAGSVGGLFCLFVLSAGAGSMKLLRGLHRDRIGAVFGLIGVVIGSILLAPMIAVPSLQSDVNARFGQAFGSDWKTRIPNSALFYMNDRPLVASEYYLPHPLQNCIIQDNISFYNGTVGVDNGLQLYFDAYLPPNNGRALPGANSTLIRIHGGGWVIGDKGLGNMPLMNYYFASQGYCVFDIQYGLSNSSVSFLNFGKMMNPPYVMGNFSIYDMARHIGLFCQYLTTHHTEYGANLSSVFVSGGSAGGHLTCLTALAIASGKYPALFGTALKIRGYIPFYPANQVAQFIDGGISPADMYDPGLMVDASSPACLIYQGEQDGLVDPQIPQNLKDTYTAQGNPACMIIYLPGAGHGSDINFYGYYNRFFLYYMERFMYLYR